MFGQKDKEAKNEMATAADGYDPHDHREVKNPLTNFGALIQLLKCALGTGTLAMPFAFSKSGWLIGLLTGPIIGIVAVYAVQILLMAMNEVCARNQQPIFTYAEAMKYGMLQGPTWLHVMSRPAKIIVEIFLAVYHFGICAVYVVFVSTSLCNFFEAFDIYINVRWYMLMLIIPLCLVYSIRSLKMLVPFSAVANVLLITGYALVLYYVFTGLPSLSIRHTHQDIILYPMFFGTVLFALESIGVMIAIEAEMAKPKAFLGLFGVLDQGMCFVVCLYIVFGFFGYWRYGEALQGSISLNIPQQTPALICKMLFAISITISYALQGYIVMDVVWFHYLDKVVPEGRKLLFEYITRIVVVLLSVVVGLTAKNLGAILSLVGAFCLSILGLIFPVLLDTCVRYGSSSYGPGYIYLIRNILIFAFGLFGGVTGTIAAIKEIIYG